MTDNSLSYRKTAKLIHKMSITGPCILAVKEGSVMAKIDTIREIEKAITAMNGQAAVIVVNDLGDIVRYDERQMAKYGWYRLETIAKLMKKERTQDEHKQ